MGNGRTVDCDSATLGAVVMCPANDMFEAYIVNYCKRLPNKGIPLLTKQSGKRTTNHLYNYKYRRLNDKHYVAWGYKVGTNKNIHTTVAVWHKWG